MTIDSSAVVAAAFGGLLTIGISVVGFMVKSVINKLDTMVSKEMCGILREGQERDRERLELDINGVGKILSNHISEAV